MYLYYLTSGFITSALAFNLLSRAFNALTRAFHLPTRAFSLITCGFELVTGRFEIVSCGFELTFPLTESPAGKHFEDFFLDTLNTAF